MSSGRRQPRRRSLRRTVALISSLSAIAFGAIFGGLSHQMAASKDPALGPKERALAAASGGRPRRRIVRRTIVVRKVHEPGAVAAAAPSPAPAPPAAAPAPPPAPVVTTVS